jgi:hypothetical protein
MAISQSEPCDNMNHRRTNSPVRNCPNCGGIVNKIIGIKRCSEQEHAARRHWPNIFCIDCGVQLIQIR